MATPIRETVVSYSAVPRHRSMNRRPWLGRRRLFPLLLSTIFALAPACGSKEEKPEVPNGKVEKTDSPPEGDRPKSLKPALTLLKVEAVDGTPADVKPDGVDLDAQLLIENAAWGPGAFTKGKASDKEGCGLTVSLVYAITANRQAVKSTNVGEARVGLIGTLHCQVGKEVTSFKADVERFKPFGQPSKEGGGQDPKAGPALLSEIAKMLAKDLVDELVGKAMLRGASDDEILSTLAKSSHVGRLLEAELEAGERRLTTAIPDLLRLTRHERGNVSMRAAAALGMLGASGDEVVAALVAMTRGSDMEKHLVAVNTLSDLKNPQVKRYLNAIADGHPEPTIRQLAREGAKRAAARETPESLKPPEAP